MPPNLFINLEYHIKPRGVFIRTNIRRSYIDDFLAEVVACQVGKGADHRESNEQEVYNIRITCDLSYDDILIKSDTGNKGLTTGIIMDSIGKWKLRKPEGQLAAKTQG